MNAYVIPGIQFLTIPQEIINKVCVAFSITPGQMMEKTRRHKIVIPRNTAMYLLRIKGFGASEIGRIFNKDHSTVIYASKSIQNLIDTKDFEYYPTIKQLI